MIVMWLKLLCRSSQQLYSGFWFGVNEFSTLPLSSRKLKLLCPFSKTLRTIRFFPEVSIIAISDEPSSLRPTQILSGVFLSPGRLSEIVNPANLLSLSLTPIKFTSCFPPYLSKDKLTPELTTSPLSFFEPEKINPPFQKPRHYKKACLLVVCQPALLLYHEQ